MHLKPFNVLLGIYGKRSCINFVNGEVGVCTQLGGASLASHTCDCIREHMPQTLNKEESHEAVHKEDHIMEDHHAFVSQSIVYKPRDILLPTGLCQ
jgi:hypothetical protein